MLAEPLEEKKPQTVSEAPNNFQTTFLAKRKNQMTNKVYRTHDNFYKTEPRSEPKQVFKEISKLISGIAKPSDRKLHLLDVGCATGDLLGYLSANHGTEYTLKGLELLVPLIEEAKRRNPGIDIKDGTVENRNTFDAQSFDVVTVLGVIQIFDEVEQIIANLISWTRPHGRVLVHGLFNPYPVDVLIKYRNVDGPDHDNNFQNGWNIISQETFRLLATRNGAKGVKYHPFEMNIDIAQKLDPVRSWTEILPNGKRQIVNGLCIKQPQYIAEVIL